MSIPPSFRMTCVEDNPIWVTKDGTPMLISDMDSSHIINTIKMLFRSVLPIRFNMLHEAYSFFSTCRGDMACDAIEGEINFLETSSDFDFLMSECDPFKYLVREAISRKLVQEVWEEDNGRSGLTLHYIT